MRILLLAPLLVLGACAQEPQQPLSPEQRAAAIQMLMNRPPVQMPRVEYHPMEIRPPGQTSCTTIPIGGGQYRTDCR